jgi:hypothetical protein
MKFPPRADLTLEDKIDVCGWKYPGLFVPVPPDGLLAV